MSATYVPATNGSGWASLTDEQQVDVGRAALRFAINTVIGQAEMLALEIENGGLMDRGGPEALRLLAIALRAAGDVHHGAHDLACRAPAGNA